MKKRPKEAHGEQAKETKGSTAAAQARGSCDSVVGQAKQPSGRAAVLGAGMPTNTAVGGSLSRSERVKKRKILTDT